MKTITFKKLYVIAVILLISLGWVLSLNFVDPGSLKLNGKEKSCQECDIPLAASWMLSY